MKLNAYARLLRYGLRQWASLVLIVGLTVANSGIAVLQPWPMKILIDHGLNVAPPPTSLTSLLDTLSLFPSPIILIILAAVGSLLLFSLSSFLDACLNLAWTGASQKMIYDLSGDLFSRLQRLSLLFHSRRAVGDSLSRLTDDTWCVCGITNSLLVSPLQHLLTLGIITVVAWNLDPALTALSLVTTPFLAGSALFFGRRMKRRNRQNRKAQAKLIAFVHQILTVIPMVQAFSAEERNNDKFRKLADESIKRAESGVLLNNTQGLINGLTATVAGAFILYFGGMRVLSGAITVGALLVFFSYTRAIQGALQGLLGIYVRLRSSEANVDRVIEDLSAEDEVAEAPNARALTILPTQRDALIQFENVTFGYEIGRPVIRNVSLKAQYGQTIALVGASGAGKTTLISLIPRFFDPWEGCITINGVDIREFRLSSLRSQVAIVLQEPLLLPLTIAENIAYGRPNASKREVIAAAEAASAHDFILHLPHGYETIIGERGATLSGGERQRLSIARAILMNAPILILDEPTSALDVGTEKKLLRAIDQLMAGRTTFIIAHRLSTIQNADVVVELANGQITALDKHDVLNPARASHSKLPIFFPAPEVAL